VSEANAHAALDDELTERLLADGGARLGRFRVESQLDAGGVGLIFAGFDDELARPVALKVLRARAIGDTRGRARLLREAQALAQLSHPNVVTVYEVGEWQDSVFVAMELIRGQTLRAWLREHRGERERFIELMIQAGRGLAAAHEVGIVHRDFKPANVLVGDDGRVRVLDFGLASATGSSDESAASSERSWAEISDAFELTVSRPGVVSGTPPYMSPEQLRGEEVDLCSDQFAFCVALYEGLYGERPFAGKTVATRLAELRDPFELPPTPRLPTRLRRVLRRGLAFEPERRFSSMNALLDALAHDPRPLRRALVAFGLGAGLIAAVVALARPDPAPADLCVETGAEITTTWNPRREAALADAYASLTAAYAPTSLAEVRAQLDDYSAAWASQRVEACHARQRGELDEAALARQLACLERGRAGLDALLLALDTDDAALLAQGPLAAARLPPVSACAELDALRSVAALPNDPATVAEIEAVELALEPLRVAWSLQRYADALPRSAARLAEAEALGHRPLIAEAELLHGQLLELAGRYEEAEAHLRRALWTADILRDDRLLAEAMAATIDVVGVAQGRYADAMAWSDHADALVERSVQGTLAEAQLLSALGRSAERHGEVAAGVERLRAALDIVRSQDPPRPPVVATSQLSLANALAALGHYDEAITLSEAGITALETTLGVDHPRVETSVSNYGNILYQAGRYEDAVDTIRRAQTMAEGIYGPKHPELATLHNNLSVALSKLGRIEEGVGALEQALAVQLDSLGERNPKTLSTIYNLGTFHARLGHPDEAREYFTRALALRREVLAPGAPTTIANLAGLGRLELEQGQTEAARAYLEQALTLREQHPEGGPPELLPLIEQRLADALGSRERARAAALRACAAARFTALDAERFAPLVEGLTAKLDGVDAGRARARRCPELTNPS